MLKRLSIMFMILGIISFCPLNAYADEGVSYLGELCFSLDDGSFAPPVPGKLGVLSYGEGHFALHGVVGLMGFSHGTAVINDEGDVIISLTATCASSDFPQVASFTDSKSMYIIVDTSTLSGNFRIMGFSWENKGTTTEIPVPFTVQGVVNFYECQ